MSACWQVFILLMSACCLLFVHELHVCLQLICPSYLSCVPAVDCAMCCLSACSSLLCICLMAECFSCFMYVGFLCCPFWQLLICSNASCVPGVLLFIFLMSACYCVFYLMLVIIHMFHINLLFAFHVCSLSPAFFHICDVCLLLVFLVFDSDSLWFCHVVRVFLLLACSYFFCLAAVCFPCCPVCLLLMFLFVKFALSYFFCLAVVCIVIYMFLCACCWFSCLFMSASCLCFHICHVCLLLMCLYDSCLPAVHVFHMSPACVFVSCHTCPLCMLLIVHTHPVWQLLMCHVLFMSAYWLGGVYVSYVLHACCWLLPVCHVFMLLVFHMVFLSTCSGMFICFLSASWSCGFMCLLSV